MSRSLSGEGPTRHPRLRTSLSRPRAQRGQLRTQQVPISRRRKAFLLPTECHSHLGRQLPGLLGHRGLMTNTHQENSLQITGTKPHSVGMSCHWLAPAPGTPEGLPRPCSDADCQHGAPVRQPPCDTGETSYVSKYNLFYFKHHYMSTLTISHLTKLFTFQFYFIPSISTTAEPTRFYRSRVRTCDLSI